MNLECFIGGFFGGCLMTIVGIWFGRLWERNKR